MKSLPEIGDVVDDTYELISVLGTGGFGAVYRARQLNMDRDVALKLLIASGPKFDEMVKRFRREVMAIRNLTHPNTVRIFDFRDHPDGLLYYTMEALEGVTLKQELKRSGPFSPRRFKRIMLQVLKSLSEAHSYSIIHRDLKPANIMLVDMHGEEDFVKVLDFGIAKLMQDGNEEGEDVEDLTSAGMLVGTLKYMAPEQIAGEQLGPHTDLYALGLIAVEMLTGESVYSGSGRWEVLRQQVSEEPVDIPQPVRDSGLGAVIERCLDKDRRRRYASADEVIAELKKLDSSKLEPQSLYVRKGDGFALRHPNPPALSAKQQQKDTVEYDSLPTMMLDEDELEPFEVAETKVTTVPGGSDIDRSASGDFPSVPDKAPSQAGKDNAGPPPLAPTEKNPAVQQHNTGVDATDEMPADSAQESGEIDRQHAELSANKFSSPAVEWDGGESKKKTKMIVGVAILALVGVGGVVGVLSMGGDDEDVDVDDALVAEEQQEDTQEEVSQEEDDADEPTIYEVRVELDDDEVTATVFLDDEEMGDTPQTVEFEDEAVLRLEADDFETFEGLIDGETSEELVLELEPSEEEEEEEEEEEAVAERETGQRPSSTQGTPGSTGQAGGAGGGGASAQDSTPQPEPAREDEEPEETPSPPQEEVEEEEPEDDDSGWVDLSDDDDPAAEEDDDVPLF